MLHEYSESKANYCRKRLYYKVTDNAPALLLEVLEEEGKEKVSSFFVHSLKISKGWNMYKEDDSPYWNLSWRNGRYTLADYNGCKPWQRMNHFPNTGIITKKVFNILVMN
jgi:tubulin polyglutamylase TTLL2